MTEPQAWVLIGTFTTAIFGALTIVTASINRVIRAEVNGLRGELVASEARMTSKIDALDRDVQAIARHVVGEPT